MEATVVASDMTRVQHQSCPSCKASIEFDPRYPVWCECGWNIQPQQTPARNAFDRAYLAISTKTGRSLLNEVLRMKSHRPRLTVGVMLAFLIALCVQGVILLVAAVGIAVVIKGWPSLYLIVLGAALLALAWFFRPRFEPLPKSVLPRQSFPALYALVDQVADSLGAPHVSGVVITGEYNASFSCAGWRRQPILYLGLPLWLNLASQERVALIGHELGHSINGDWLRSFWVGGAIRILLTWYALVDPADASPRVRGTLGLGYDLGILLLYPIRMLVKALAFALASLLWRSSQRAEYLADYLGATTSGSAAALSMLDRLHYGWNFTVMVDVLLTEKRRMSLADLQQRFAAIPVRELERMRRVAQLEKTRLDVTHPPTAYRIEFLSARWLEARIVLSQSNSDRIDQELAPVMPEVERQIAYHFGRA